MNEPLCYGSPDVFFPEEETEETVAPAKAICAECDCRWACLDRSLYEEFGVWGGLAVWQRKSFRYTLNRSYLEILPAIDATVDTLVRVKV